MPKQDAPTSTPVRIRGEAHRTIKKIADQHRITIVDAIEIAIDRFAGMTSTARRKLIDNPKPRRHP